MRRGDADADLVERVGTAAEALHGRVPGLRGGPAPQAPAGAIGDVDGVLVEPPEERSAFTCGG